ncbi:electron transfer flavoprotein subunit alpha/FixB family protein [Aminivibrio sp.]|jgi:electron transfer flavoprotein alpha subunit|uniref:electron transfer flavoprotein subunit alpha/FixB family protein n=1 Tax=Aminivibrio sp. TaxID=1872489 RepID=UPI001A4422BE|nr:electron transfer flavoprotein subunit alpha/FixB family protein [Aminivibrio sp.]MBL3539908.1 electron transfer flavoprotein subunit alpha/FixB family protein [Aminivibrio sp.]MDK2959535.1 electron transfer flavoprotein alpha subunit [Synergistaceae bacterium]
MTEKQFFVLGEVRDGHIHSVTFELTGKAGDLADTCGGTVTTVLLSGGLADDPEALLRGGADRVMTVEHPSLSMFNQEAEVKVLAHLLRQEAPDVVLAPATTSGRTTMPALAAELETGLTADCTGLEMDRETGLLLQTRPAIGGNVMATIKTPMRRPQMATVRPRTFRARDRSKAVSRGGVVRPEIPSELFGSRVVNLGFERAEDGGSNIQDLDVVVSGGKGLKRPESFRMLEELAALLGGGVGASRPAVDAKWMGYPHQVGLSGKVVAPKVYIAAGISGAVQHLAGMQTAGYVVAVNRDPDASIFRVADLGLCGDLFDILPRLTERIRKEVGAE